MKKRKPSLPMPPYLAGVGANLRGYSRSKGTKLVSSSRLGTNEENEAINGGVRHDAESAPTETRTDDHDDIYEGECLVETDLNKLPSQTSSSR